MLRGNLLYKEHVAVAFRVRVAADIRVVDRKHIHAAGPVKEQSVDGSGLSTKGHENGNGEI